MERLAYICDHVLQHNLRIKRVSYRGENVSLSCDIAFHSFDDWKPVGMEHFVERGDIPSHMLTMEGRFDLTRNDNGNWMLDPEAVPDID